MCRYALWIPPPPPPPANTPMWEPTCIITKHIDLRSISTVMETLLPPWKLQFECADLEIFSTGDELWKHLPNACTNMLIRPVRMSLHSWWTEARRQSQRWTNRRRQLKPAHAQQNVLCLSFQCRSLFCNPLHSLERWFESCQEMPLGNLSHI